MYQYLRIFVMYLATSYDEYAVRAFKVNSIDYLLKPIEKEELEIALKKVDLERKKNFPSIEIEQLLNLFKKQSPVYRKRFLLSKVNGYKTIAINEIGYIFTEQKITYLVTYNKNVEVLGQALDELEEELDPDQFFRANRQFIVHIDNIGMIRNDNNGKLRVILKNDDKVEIIVSREKASFIKKWLDR